MSKATREDMEYINKVWGYELIVTNNEEYCGKIMGFNKGHSSSVHYHKLKKETFLLKRGKIRLEWIDIAGFKEEDIKVMYEEHDAGVPLTKIKMEVLDSGDAFELPRGRVHRVTALEDSEVIEFSTPSQDSDSYRIIQSK